MALNGAGNGKQVMNNAEINLAIAKLEYPNLEWFGADHLAVTWNNGCRTECDYLQWSDIGPIIEREKIDLHYEPMTDGKDWHAASCGNIAEVWADTPTKAAALCYLRMKGVEL